MPQPEDSPAARMAIPWSAATRLSVSSDLWSMHMSVYWSKSRIQPPIGAGRIAAPSVHGREMASAKISPVASASTHGPKGVGATAWRSTRMMRTRVQRWPSIQKYWSLTQPRVTGVFVAQVEGRGQSQND
eukprot:scaffold261567_cov35-Tisochrysis_lutea.AAC.3